MALVTRIWEELCAYCPGTRHLVHKASKNWRSQSVLGIPLLPGLGRVLTSLGVGFLIFKMGPFLTLHT